jgi:glutamate synthase (ferredoxin)
VSVKLVAEAGIGTVASGVAKANADVIQISGHDGGTGASPVSSIKHAGGPMEMGLVETHNTLVENELRERVVLRVDGGVRTGLDVLKAAAMGGDEYGFGTVAMIATGCIMARVCHTNNCPVGVASQREELRARFPGTPGDVVNYFHVRYPFLLRNPVLCVSQYVIHHVLPHFGQSQLPRFHFSNHVLSFFIPMHCSMSE